MARKFLMYDPAKMTYEEAKTVTPVGVSEIVRGIPGSVRRKMPELTEDDLPYVYEEPDPPPPKVHRNLLTEIDQIKQDMEGKATPEEITTALEDYLTKAAFDIWKSDVETRLDKLEGRT